MSTSSQSENEATGTGTPENDTQNSGDVTTLVGSSLGDEPMEIEIGPTSTPVPQKGGIKEAAIATVPDQGPPVKCKCVKMGQNRVPIVVKPIQPCFAQNCLIQLVQEKFMEFLQKSLTDPSPPPQPPQGGTTKN